MKSLLLLLLALSSFALTLEMKTFKADFTQIVTDENKKELQYEGLLYAKYPNQSLWKYETPIEKDIYINDRVVTVIEPDLEQVIIQNMENEIDILQIMKDAQESEKGIYVTTFAGVDYSIKMKENVPVQITYKDKFDNSVKIIFKNVDTKSKIEKKQFLAKYPEDFDVIKN